jgi:hypothetical protein
VNQTHRRVVVLSTLVSVLTLTSALLLALAPAPLAPDAASSLFAVEAPQSMDAVFRTAEPVAPGRWRYIFVRHTRTPGGNAMTLSNSIYGMGDHFLIGNGDGAIDGEIQVGHRWNIQEGALPPAPGVKIAGDCITISVVGDFDRSVPTPTQLRRLGQLVGTLQGRLRIPAGNVILLDAPDTNAGAGKYFPATAFRDQLLP